MHLGHSFGINPEKRRKTAVREGGGGVGGETEFWKVGKNLDDADMMPPIFLLENGMIGLLPPPHVLDEFAQRWWANRIRTWLNWVRFQQRMGIYYLQHQQNTKMLLFTKQEHYLSAQKNTGVSLDSKNFRWQLGEYQAHSIFQPQPKMTKPASLTLTDLRGYKTEFFCSNSSTVSN